VLTRAALACAALCILTACATPAPNLPAYQSKAARTASSALSELQTARLAARQSRSGRISQSYLEVLVSDSEDAYGSVTSTFDSVQPPDEPAADKIRSTLDDLLQPGGDAISALRIAIRRRDTAAITALDKPLGDAATALSTFDPTALR
jgi:hypothetical protein